MVNNNNNETPAGDDGAVDGDLVVPLEDDRGGYGSEMTGQVRRRESGLGVGVHGYVLTHLKPGVYMMQLNFIFPSREFSPFIKRFFPLSSFSFSPNQSCKFPAQMFQSLT